MTKRRTLLSILLLVGCAGEDPAAVPVAEAPPEPRLPAAELACVARAAYFEARGEGEGGMAAVAHVVMNRADSDAYPETPCAVVEQQRSGRCQFSWACDGLSDRPADEAVYDRALKIAGAVAAGERSDPTAGATMFHAAGVTPYWTAEAEHTATVGSHLFYRLD